MIKDKQIKLIIGKISRRNTTHYMQIGYTDGTTVWVMEVQSTKFLSGNVEQIKKCIPKSKLHKVGITNLGENDRCIGELTRARMNHIIKILPILNYEEVRKMRVFKRCFNSGNTFIPYETSIRSSN